MHVYIKYFTLLSLLLIVTIVKAQSVKTTDYKNPAFSFSERAKDLVSRMTLEEKVSQMMNQSAAIDRLGIPAYNWWNEGLHGVARTKMHVTVFPQAIGLAASFDKRAMFKMADITSTEARIVHNEYVKKSERGIYQGLTFWTPNINIFRDPRWGRGQETYGEDPYLTGQMGMALVRGFQGDDPKYLKITACAKHFAVHSGPESNRHAFDVKVSPYDLTDTYLPAFRDLIVEAKVASVMCAYNAYAGQPCCGNDLLMSNILYNKWNFHGYVTSDCGAIDDFYRGHHTSADAASASADAVLHGTDIECGSSYRSLVEAVKKGMLDEKKIDVSVSNLLEIRFRLGMFDPPEMVKYNSIPFSSLDSKTSREHALKMARESIVLLKNENHLLPISNHLKKIAVLGPNADNPVSVLGNYNGTPSSVITLLEGIREKVGDRTEVLYVPGAEYIQKKIGSDPAILAQKVKDADLIIFAGGISPALEGEEMSVKAEGFSGGDRTSIDLPAVQTELLKALQATGKPVVFVMMTGSALGIQWEASHLPAIVNAWYGGQSAGTAIADVLFGDYNPAGRLPVTFYQSTDQLPAFTDYSMEGRTYRYFKGEPLYPFGYGLSYTSFVYSNLKMPSLAETGKTIPVAVDIQNTGARDGDEVVQIYLKHTGTKQRVPLCSLEGFDRIHLKPGEKKTVRFKLSPRQLSVVNEDGSRTEIPGTIEIFTASCMPISQMLTERKKLHSSVKLTGEKKVIDDSYN